MQTFENAIYQFVACKNRVLFAFNSDNQRMYIIHIDTKKELTYWHHDRILSGILIGSYSGS